MEDYRRDKIEAVAARLIDVAGEYKISKSELHAALGIALYDMAPKRVDRLKIEAFVVWLESKKWKTCRPVF